MAKINNRLAYNEKQLLSVMDYFLITDSQDSNRTKSAGFEKVLNLINALNGNSSLVYKFSNEQNLEIFTGTPGYFFSQDEIQNLQNIQRLYFNNLSNQEQDLSSLFQFAVQSNSFLLKLVNAANPNNLVYLKVSDFVQEIDHVHFLAELFNGLGQGILQDEAIYVCYFEFNLTNLFPDPIIGINAINYISKYDATNNQPYLSNSIPAMRSVYKVSIAGTQDFGLGPIVMNVGDYLINIDNEWGHLANNSQTPDLSGYITDAEFSDFQEAVEDAISIEATARADEDIVLAAAIEQVYIDLRDGVATTGNTLQKLYNLIIGGFSEITVANIAARDAYNVDELPLNIFVTDDGDGKWALYKATTTGVGATFVKINDQDSLNNALSASAIKAAYESNPDTNAFTNALLGKLDAISGTNTGDETLVSIQAKLVSTTNLPEGTNLYFTVARFLANLTFANIIASLGFTPLNKAGDTITGVMTFLNGFFGFRNVANTFTSFIRNFNTASRTYTFQDRDGTVAHLDDITASATTYFVNLTTGNDATAAIGNRNLPYQTLTAVLTSINSSLTDNFHIVFQTRDTYNSTVVIPQKNITFLGTQLNGNQTNLSFSTVTNVCPQTLNITNIISFNNIDVNFTGTQNITNNNLQIIFNRASINTSSTISTLFQILSFNGYIINLTGSGNYIFRGFHGSGNTQSSNLTIENFSANCTIFRECSNIEAYVKNISGTGVKIMAVSCINNCYFKIGTVTMTSGSLLLSGQCDNSNTFEFINTSIPTGVTVDWEHQGIITGYMNRFSPNGISSPFGRSGAIAQFINFTGRLNNIILISNLNIPHYFINCNIITSGNLLSTFLQSSTPFTAGTKIFFRGHNTFIQDTDVPLINATATPIQIERQGANSIQSNRATLASGTVTVVNIPLNQL